MEKEKTRLTEHFGTNLAQLLSDKICKTEKDFPSQTLQHGQKSWNFLSATPNPFLKF